MELMRTSLDNFYKIVEERNEKIPEKVLGKVTFAVSMPSRSKGINKIIFWMKKCKSSFVGKVMHYDFGL